MGWIGKALGIKDLEKISIADLELRNSYLSQQIQIYETAIRKHRDAVGHDRCFENDIELYDLLPEGCLEHPAKDTIPSEKEFLSGCKKYYDGLCPKVNFDKIVSIETVES